MEQNMIIGFIKNANAVLAFLLELGVLVALGYWGFTSGQGVVAKIGLGIGAPVIAIVVWGMFGAPNSAWHLHEPWFFLLQVIFFGSAAIALYAAHQRTLGIGFALVLALNLALTYTLGVGTLGQ